MNWTQTRDALIAAGISAAQLPEEWQPGIDLSEANLTGANLREVNLSRADLAGADLREANLAGVNLTEANLTEANLTEANLTWADLTGADLTWADLTRANLTRANLTGATLTGADLTGANLTEAEGPFTHGYFGRHHAVAAGGYISIGCERHAYEWWLNNHQKCGSRHWYTADEIADYGAWIELAVARQRRIETTPPAA